jgi:hypothetical protein
MAKEGAARPRPSLGFFTIGDPCLHVYDRSADTFINYMMDDNNTDFCTAVEHFNADKGLLKFPCAVHSTAG